MLMGNWRESLRFILYVSTRKKASLLRVIKRGPSFDVTFLQAQAAWLRRNVLTAQEALRKTWKETNAGDRATMRRDFERLFEEHPELAGKDELQGIMKSGNEQSTE